VAALRSRQENKGAAVGKYDNGRDGRGSRALTDSHEISSRKHEESVKLRNAFGIGEDFKAGASFDKELQEERRVQRLVFAYAR
jgi:hypothetical protein